MSIKIIDLEANNSIDLEPHFRCESFKKLNTLINEYPGTMIIVTGITWALGVATVITLL